MQLKILEGHNIIQPCDIPNLPDFVVITGTNGSGKTQLLTAINIGLGELSEGLTRFPITRFVNLGFQYSYSHPAEIAYQHYQDEWERLAVLVPVSDLFLKYDPVTEGSAAEINELINVFYQEMRSQGNPGVTVPSLPAIPPNDFQQIIDLRKKIKTDKITFQDYFAFVHFGNELLASNLPLLFHQFTLKEQFFPETVIGVDAPWVLFDELLARTGSNYRLHFAAERFLQEPSPILLKHRSKDLIVSIDSLSSGERTILSLVIVLYNTENLSDGNIVLLLDEPDAFLHPSLADIFLKAVIDELVVKRGIKVIMTTHSPSTVALSPAESIYVMDSELGYPMPAEKNWAIRLLTKGLTTFSVSLDNRKQIFTEAEDDRKFYQLIFEKLMNDSLLPNDQLLEFIPVTGKSNENGGGVDKVIALTEMFFESGNRNIYGLIDWDCVEREKIDKVTVFGNKSRYNIENFIYDPIFIGAYMLQYNISKLTDFGFDKSDDHTSFLKFKTKRLQAIIDIIAPQVFDSMDWTKETRGEGIKSCEPIDVELIIGEKVTVPKWYTVANGHAIVDACKNAFVSTRERPTSWWIEFIVKPNFIFLPVEVKNTFMYLQNLRMRADDEQ